MENFNNNKKSKFTLKFKDIYSGEEQISFNERHPIFKALMKLEFEEVLRKVLRK